MLGAILIVSGPTVVAPLLEGARPGRRLTAILGWEGTTIDPIGAIIGALVFQALTTEVSFRPTAELLQFAGNIGLGLLGGVVGTVALWLLVEKLELHGVLATEATVATVVGIAAACNALHDDSGLVAAITMGVAVANVPGIKSPEDRPFFRTIVQLIIGLLFISISATVTPSSVRGVVWPTVALVAGLIVIVRPLVAAVATLRTNLPGRKRVFIGLIDHAACVRGFHGRNVCRTPHRSGHRRRRRSPASDFPGHRRHGDDLRARRRSGRPAVGHCHVNRRTNSRRPAAGVDHENYDPPATPLGCPLRPRRGQV